MAAGTDGSLIIVPAREIVYPPGAVVVQSLTPRRRCNRVRWMLKERD
jgi:hypothetical protein